MTYRGPYKVRVEEKPDPQIEHPNDAIVRVERAAICRSDLHLFHGMLPDTRIGHTFGHEFIGRVEEVGASVRNISVGDRVMVPFNICCDTCFFCAHGLFSNCHNVNANATAVGGIYKDVVVALKKLTDGLGADVVIDAVGAEADGHLVQHVSSAKLKLQGGSPIALN